MSTHPTALPAVARIPAAGRGPLSRPCENCGARAGEKCFWYCTARPTKHTDRSRQAATARRLGATGTTVLLAACALAAVSGCSSTAPATNADTPRAATSPDSDSALSGAHLHQLLPTAKMFVAGVTVAASADTGTAWINPAHLPTPSLPAEGCEQALRISASTFTSDYRAAAATETLAVGTSTVQVVLEAANPGGAEQQIAEDTAYAQRCAGAGLTLDSYAELGDQAIRIRLYSPTDPDVPEVELVRVGDVIAAVSDTDLARDESVTASVTGYLAHQLEARSV